ncbi:MAG: DUF2953 domain-containing protein [Lachnospiraceae bacterium]|jgi:hypothetical protein
MIFLTGLLAVLKWIGIVLLWILLILLILLALILFVPVRYRARAEIPDRFAENPEKIRGEAEFSWLLRLAGYRYSTDPAAGRPNGFRIAGFVFGGRADSASGAGRRGRRRKPRRKAERFRRNPHKPEDSGAGTGAAGNAKETGEDRQPETPVRPGRENQESRDALKDSEQLDQVMEEASVDDWEDSPGRTDGRGADSAAGSRGAPGGKSGDRKSRAEGRRGRQGARSSGTAGRIAGMLKWFFGGEMEPVRGKLLRTLKGIAGDIFPRKGNIRLRFGLDDPSVTGQVLGFLAMLYPLFSGNMNVEPDFEKPVLEGSVDVSGRIFAGVIGFYVLRLLADKKVRASISKLRKELSDGR